MQGNLWQPLASTCMIMSITRCVYTPLLLVTLIPAELYRTLLQMLPSFFEQCTACLHLCRPGVYVTALMRSDKIKA